MGAERDAQFRAQDSQRADGNGSTQCIFDGTGSFVAGQQYVVTWIHS